MQISHLLFGVRFGENMANFESIVNRNLTVNKDLPSTSPFGPSLATLLQPS